MGVARNSPRGEDHGTMSGWVNAEIRVWIECVRCGRINKPSAPVSIPEELAFAATEQVCMTCERCQGHAMMYLQRALARLH
jgi:hypothetical protein